MNKTAFCGIYVSVRFITATLWLYLSLFWGLWGGTTLSAHAQTDTPPGPGNLAGKHHTQARLILSATTAKPGDTIWAGVDLQMDPGWHTYWKNPGDAGIATAIKWQLPPGITAGNIVWPLPEKLPPIEVTVYAYDNEVVLLVPLTIQTNVPPGPLDLSAHLTWLECQQVCIPAGQDVAATLNIGSETKISAAAATIDLWKSKTPEPGDFLKAAAWWEKTTNDDTRILTLTWPSPTVNGATDFFPGPSDNYEVQAPTKDISRPGTAGLRKEVKKFSGDWPNAISGVIVLQNGNSREGYDVTLPVSDSAPSQDKSAAMSSVSSSPPISATASMPAPPSLWQMFLYAFIGGLILNLMPCVLPVIALKILAFVGEAKSSPRRLRALGGLYAVGVLFSFTVLAGIVIGVQAAGRQIGWGFQFGNPIFLVSLVTLVLLVALNLFGVFEVTLGGRALDTAGELAGRHGVAGAFFNGVLATALATPCTAPFLGAALGFAFAQPPVIILLIFLTVGLGLATPYVLLSWNPAWLKFLPKPGAWMEKFKIAMGFPMLATVVWLFNLADDNYGKNTLWLGIFLVIIASAAWVFGEFVQRGRRHQTAATIVVLLLLAGGYAFALEKELDWRHPVPVTTLTDSTGPIHWQPWSPDAVAQARAAGHPVLVDFTADWCLTCQVNKKTSIEIPSVEKKLTDLGAVALVADYTHTPANITTELARYNRAGVPLVLVYSKNPADPPQVLPAILTPGTVLNALEQ